MPPGWPQIEGTEAPSPQRRLETRGDLGVPVDRFLVVTATDLVARSRPEDVVMVANHLRDEQGLEMLLVGEGPLESHVVDLMGYLGPSGLRLCRPRFALHDLVAAADLAHVGPAFGGHPLGLVERALLQSADDALLERIQAGDADGFLAEVRSVGDRNNVCGVPPIYLALRLLDPVRGTPVAHLRCPADESEASWVTICGVVLH